MVACCCATIVRIICPCLIAQLWWPFAVCLYGYASRLCINASGAHCCTATLAPSQVLSCSTSWPEVSFLFAVARKAVFCVGASPHTFSSTGGCIRRQDVRLRRDNLLGAVSLSLHNWSILALLCLHECVPPYTLKWLQICTLLTCLCQNCILSASLSCCTKLWLNPR